MEKYKKIIANTKTLKEIDNFINNAKKSGEDEVLQLAYARRAELVRADFEATGRRPDINYREIGLNIGDTVTHMASGKKATVATERTLSFRGFEDYITNIQDTLNKEMELNKTPMAKKYPKTVWKTDAGDTLDELYLKAYGVKI